MSHTSPTPKKRWIADLILAGSILFLLSVGILVSLWVRGEGDTVTILIDGKVTYTYSLSQDREYWIETPVGKNLLIIENGRARVESASCPDGICAAHAPIHREGDTIVCLPHKLVIRIDRANPDSDAPDILISLPPKI